jgi:hypothetical protein
VTQLCICWSQHKIKKETSANFTIHMTRTVTNKCVDRNLLDTTQLHPGPVIITYTYSVENKPILLRYSHPPDLHAQPTFLSFIWLQWRHSVGCINYHEPRLWLFRMCSYVVLQIAIDVSEKTSFKVWQYCSCCVLCCRLAAQTSVYHVLRIRSWTRPENEWQKRVHRRGTKRYTGGAQKGTHEGHKRVQIRGTRGYMQGAQKVTYEGHKRVHIRVTRRYIGGVHEGTQEGHKRVHEGHMGVHTKSAAICMNIFFTLLLHLC